MDRRIINPWTWQDNFGFVQGHEVTGAQRVLYCAGQAATDADGRPVHPEDMAAQLRQSLDGRAIAIRTALLVAAMIPIVLLAHDLAILIDHGIAVTRAPVALGGVLIAIVVFTPESMTAIRAALADQMQRVINLCLGAFLSTVGLTVPAVLIVGAVTGKPVVMGLSAMDTALFALTLAVHMLTLIGHRTTPIQGLMHLTLFAVYAILLFSP